MSSPYEPPKASSSAERAAPSKRIAHAVAAGVASLLGPVLVAVWSDQISLLVLSLPFLSLLAIIVGAMVIPFRRMPTWLGLVVGPFLGVMLLVAGALLFSFISERLQ